MLLGKLKELFLEKKLLSELQLQIREKTFINYNQIKTVGIIFEATETEQFEFIKDYVIKLKQEGKRVHCLGFYDEKIIPDNLYYSKTDFDLFHSKDLNLIGEPVSPYIKTFTSEIRDLLIEVNFNKKYPLRYIAAHSFAKCKIGLDLPENKPIHDILFSVNTMDGIGYYFSQIDKYLQMINQQN